jgi:hypothetical protein
VSITVSRAWPTGYLTEAQVQALRLLDRAYEEDVAVVAGRSTGWGNGTQPTMQRGTAIRLARLGLARFSHPSARYVLITPTGRGLPFLQL